MLPRCASAIAPICYHGRTPIVRSRPRTPLPPRSVAAATRPRDGPADAASQSKSRSGGAGSARLAAALPRTARQRVAARPLVLDRAPEQRSRRSVRPQDAARPSRFGCRTLGRRATPRALVGRHQRRVAHGPPTVSSDLRRAMPALYLSRRPRARSSGQELAKWYTSLSPRLPVRSGRRAVGSSS